MVSKYAIKNENYSNMTDFEHHFHCKITLAVCRAKRALGYGRTSGGYQHKKAIQRGMQSYQSALRSRENDDPSPLMVIGGLCPAVGCIAGIIKINNRRALATWMHLTSTSMGSTAYPYRTSHPIFSSSI